MYLNVKCIQAILNPSSTLNDPIRLERTYQPVQKYRETIIPIIHGTRSSMVCIVVRLYPYWVL